MYAYFSLSIIDFPLPYLPNGRKFLRLACRLKFAAFYAISGSLFAILFMSECPVCFRVPCNRGRGDFCFAGSSFFSSFTMFFLSLFPVFSLFVYQMRAYMEKKQWKTAAHTRSKKRRINLRRFFFALEFQRANLRALLFCLRRLRRRPCAGSSVWFCPWGCPVCP